MLLLFFGVLFSFFLGAFIFRDPAGAILLAMLGWFLVGMYACEDIRKGDEEYRVRDTTEIQSALTGSGVKGSFFLGSGTIDDIRFYAYWTTEGTHREGAVERRRINDHNWDVEIVETDTLSQIVFTEYKKEETWNKVYFDAGYQRATIYVPEGTVKYNYDIRAK